MLQSATSPIRLPGEHPKVEKAPAPATAPLHAQNPEDERLAERVENALRATGYSALHAVRVSVSTGVVVLRGRVSSHYLKQSVQAAALAVPGAHQICNGLDVVQPKGKPGRKPHRGAADAHDPCGR